MKNFVQNTASNIIGNIGGDFLKAIPKKASSSMISRYHSSVSYSYDENSYYLYHTVLRIIVYRLIRKRYPNSYILGKYPKYEYTYKIFNNTRLYIEDGVYLVPLKHMHMIKITVKTESTNDNKGFSHMRINYLFDFYGSYANCVANKFIDSKDKLDKKYLDKKATLANQRDYEYGVVMESRTITYDLVTFDHLIFKEKKMLIQLINQFLKSSDLYAKVGVPYKLGILLYGVPGTGKTAIAKAISEKYDRDLYVIESRRNYTIAFNGVSDAVFLIDEIDMIIKDSFMTNEGVYMDKIDPYSLRTLLTGIDSVGSGNIIVAITNHIEDLDPALLRNGRFDVKINMGNLDFDEMKEMCKLFDVNYHEILQYLGTITPDFRINPAYLQNVLKQYRMAKDSGNISNILIPVEGE